MNDLWKKITRLSIRSLSIIGLSKNAGKTTVCHALVQELKDHLRLGLVSIGVDGEERDHWSGLPKPPIYVSTGNIVATANTLFDQQAGNWEVLCHTGIHSILGEIYLAKAKQDTYIKLAGIPTLSGIQKVLSQMDRWGVDLVLVDGAYDRRVSASPGVTDASVLVVGASMGHSLQKIAAKVEETLHLFRLPACEDEKVHLFMQKAIEENCLYAKSSERWKALSYSSLLPMTQSEISSLSKYEGLIVSGALTDHNLRALLQKSPHLHIYVPDATHLFVSLATLRQFYRSGGKINVLKSINLLFLAINPVSPDGFSFNHEELKERLTPICSPLPIVNLVRE
ncbi:hypothetical protein [Thermoflavimicrobium daqui]|jgi:hypothetical protein|uniref:Uncharacterized protein n=1 Tax=Thermoflavimicrobium daqui TaxID=2137476 RepID=A0A364K3G2_9BACL|nr:hypothetical protein [Thermoflavimicrobium daqui]RAL23363.1 hypothetical protein DL897_11775 [Thermoflavimicrobium daqui]